jgi:1-acyl-sn-glycerol-3-phosphate acyltransferase
VFAISGMELHTTGVAPEPGRPVLYVANHVSWLDIYALLAISDMRFVAKSEVRDWPVVGRLAQRLGTLFIDRQRRAASRTTNAAMATLLARGEAVCVFPEGTTTDGRRVEPFRASLLEPAVLGAVTVQPVAIRYTAVSGELSEAALFIDDMSLPESLWRLMGARGLRAEVHFLEPIDAKGSDRRQLAARAEQAIAAQLGVPVRSQPREQPAVAGEGAIAFDLAAR